ncbi:MAG: leucine-rich repeat domain-containing protein [Bdellovibrionota bacterium]
MSPDISHENLHDNDPLKTAFSRLQSARDKLIASDPMTAPLDELSTLTEKLRTAKDLFQEALEQDQQTNTAEVHGHTIWKREYEALEQIAKRDGRDLYDILCSIHGSKDGRITALNLDYMRLSDITPLARLIEVQVLHLNHTHISDISPLRGLPKLRELWLHNIRLPDTEDNVATLNALDGRECTIHGALLESECQVVQRLAELNGLDPNTVMKGIYETKKGQITGLKIQEMLLSDISPLQELAHLQSLNLNNCGLTNITPLAELYFLERLTLEGNQLTDITPLKELQRLEMLALGDNRLSDISPLSSLSRLEMLWLDDNLIGDITPIENLHKLEMVWLNKNELSDITPLAGLTQLERLALEHNHITDSTENRATCRHLRDHGCKIIGIPL